MTAPELENLRAELIQTAAVIVSALEDIDYGEANVGRSLEQMARKSVDHPYLPTGEYTASQTDVILQLVRDERVRQDEKWGPQHHRMADWLAIIGEEYGEACMAYVDDLLMPTILEQKRIGMGKPIRWAKADPADYGKPSTMPAPPDDVLVARGFARLQGEVLDPYVVENIAEQTEAEVETDVDPADELKDVFDRLRDLDEHGN